MSARLVSPEAKAAKAAQDATVQWLGAIITFSGKNVTAFTLEEFVAVEKQRLKMAVAPIMY